MKLFDAIGDFLKTLFVPPEVTEKKKKPGAQTHGGFSDGFQKAPNARVNLTGVTPALIVVPEDKPEAAPQPDNEFLASVDDLALLAEAPTEAVAVENVNAPVATVSAEAHEATSDEPMAPANESIRSLMETALEVPSHEATSDEATAPADESTRSLIEMMNAVMVVPTAPANEATSSDTSTSSLMETMNAVREAPVALGETASGAPTTPTSESTRLRIETMSEAPVVPRASEPDESKRDALSEAATAPLSENT